MKTSKVTVKEDITYGGFIVLKGTVITIEQDVEGVGTMNVYFSHEGEDYTIGKPPYKVDNTPITESEKTIDQIITEICIQATIQNVHKKREKVKCDCICHKEEYKGRIKHCFPCCDNGYKYK